MKVETAAEVLLGELYQISKETGGKPLVNLCARAEQQGIKDRAFLEEVVRTMRSKYWIEEPRDSPSGDLFTRITVQGILMEERRGRLATLGE